MTCFSATINHANVHFLLQSKTYWPETEKWLQQRYAQLLHPAYSQRGNFKILGYQWRVLRFNDDTRQSTAKVMAAYRENDPSSLCLMQQPQCLAVPCRLVCPLYFPYTPGMLSFVFHKWLDNTLFNYFRSHGFDHSVSDELFLQQETF